MQNACDAALAAEGFGAQPRPNKNKKQKTKNKKPFFGEKWFRNGLDRCLHGIYKEVDRYEDKKADSLANVCYNDSNR